MSYRVPLEKMEHIARLSERPTWPLASGAGRLFEAAGALIGLRASNTYEGEAALLLESLASRAKHLPSAWPEIECGDLFPSHALLATMANRISCGEKAPLVAAGFHVTFSKVLAEYARRRFAPDIHTVVVGGGCMVNRLLRSAMTSELKSQGFEVRMPSEIPPGDGGLSFGQAVLGAVCLARNCAPAMIEAQTCV
jgi:hydrogenase maturation protein HypF